MGKQKEAGGMSLIKTNEQLKPRQTPAALIVRCRSKTLLKTHQPKKRIYSLDGNRPEV
jgi:hypothetical protein